MDLRGRCVAALCCIFCACAGVQRAYAQPDTALRVSFGLRGEYGFTSLSVRPYAETHGGKRFGGGVFLRLDNSNIFALNVGFNYAAASYRVVETAARPFNEASFVPGEQACRQQWVELPLIAEIGWNFSRWRVYALGGCYADFLIREKFGQRGGELQRQTLLWSTHYRLGAGLIGGAGVGIATRGGTLVFEYRAAMRLVSLYKRTVEGGLVAPRQRLSAQAFGLSYYYTITIRKKGRTE